MSTGAPSPLVTACGHHCGIATSSDVRQEGHCPCRECHGEPTGPMVVTKVEPYATADEETHDLLALVADVGSPVGSDAVALFLAACERDARDHGGLVSVNRVRTLLDGEDLEPRRYSSFWSRFTGPAPTGRPMRRTGEWETCEGSASGNDGRPYPVRRWVGTS